MNRVTFDLGRCSLALGNRLAAEAYFAQLWDDAADGKLSRAARTILDPYDPQPPEREGDGA